MKDNIEKQKLTENRLHILNRLYAFLSDMNLAIVRIKTKPELFQEICRIAVETGQFRMAWVGLEREPGSKIQPVAHYGHEDGFLEIVTATQGQNTDKVTEYVRENVRAGNLVVFDNFGKSSGNSLDSSEALKRGYRSLAVIPLKTRSKVVGGFSIFCDKRSFFAEERDLLQKIGDNVSYALETIDLENEQKKVAEALKLSEERLRAQYKAIPIPTYTWRKLDNDFELIDFNEAGYAATTGKIAGSIGIKCSELFDDRLAVCQAISECYESHTTLKREMGYQTKFTGETKHIILTCVFISPDMVMVHVEDITERKEAEKKIQESEAHFRLLTKLSPVPLALVNGQGEIEYVNDRFTATFGYAAKDVPTLETWFQRAYPEPQYRQSVISSWSQALEKSRFENKQFEPQEYLVNGKEGAVHIVEISSADIGTKHLTVFNDITARRQIEEALRQSDKFNKDLLENAPNPVLATNLDTSVRYVNPAFEKLTGFTARELLGCKSPYPWWPRENAQQFEAANTDGRKRELNRLERCYQNKNGDRFWVTSLIKPIKNGAEVRYYLSNWVDITARRKAEELLKESEAFNASLLNDAPNPVIVINLDFSIRFVNPAFEILTGFPFQEVVGVKPPYPWWSLENVEQYSAEIGAARQVGFNILERKYRKKNGDYFWVSNKISLIKKDGGKSVLFRELGGYHRGQKSRRRPEASRGEA